MTAEMLESLRLRLGISTANFHKLLGYKKIEMKELMRKYWKTPIDDPEFAARVLNSIPKLALERMQVINDELQELHSYGKPLDALGEVLVKAERNERFKERFGEDLEQ